jgi:hypothetical protein
MIESDNELIQSKFLSSTVKFKKTKYEGVSLKSTMLL